MDTPYRTSHSFPELSPRPPRSWLRLGLFLAPGLGLMLGAALLEGAVLLHQVEPDLGVHTTPEFPRVLAGVVVVLATLVLPVLSGLVVTHVARRTNPFARARPGPMVVLWNVLALVALALGPAATTRASLERYGDWMVQDLHGPLPPAVRRGTRWIAVRLPRGVAFAGPSSVPEASPRLPAP